MIISCVNRTLIINKDDLGLHTYANLVVVGSEREKKDKYFAIMMTTENFFFFRIGREMIEIDFTYCFSENFLHHRIRLEGGG